MTEDIIFSEEDLLAHPERGFAAITAGRILDKRLSDSEFRTYCYLLSLCPTSKTIDSDYDTIVNSIVNSLGYRTIDVCNYIIKLQCIGLINIEDTHTIKIIFK